MKNQVQKRQMIDLKYIRRANTEWCGRGDSNPHVVLLTLAPQTSASANSATSAFHRIDRI